MINGQVNACEPDPIYKDSAAGIYPRPITAMNPNGGIDKIACIGHPYEFIFTVSMPDTVVVPIDTNGNTLTVGLFSGRIDTTGAIDGLPEGIDYACNPPDCIFEKNTIGCLVLRGTPSPNNQVGEYRPIIHMRLSTILGVFNVDFPGDFFPGEYILRLDDSACVSSNILIPSEQHELSIFPNPTSGEIRLKYAGEISENSSIHIIHSSGMLVRGTSLVRK